MISLTQEEAAEVARIVSDLDDDSCPPTPADVFAAVATGHAPLLERVFLDMTPQTADELYQVIGAEIDAARWRIALQTVP